MKWTKIKLEELQRRLDNNISVIEIAKMYDLTRNRIYQIIDKYNIKLNN